jgi:GTPase SAR1 family protein
MASVPPIIFVGNKKDLTDDKSHVRAVSPDDVANVMRSCEEASSRIQLRDSEKHEAGWSMLHFEASALSGEKIDEMFEILVREIRERRKPSLKKKKKGFFSSWCNIL